MAFEKPDQSNQVLSELVNRINEDRRRIRMIEQSIDRIESSINALERNLLNQNADMKISLDRIDNKIADMSTRLTTLEADVNRYTKLVSKAATKMEIKQLESFIDIINPITSKFVTKDELDRALEEKVRAEVL